MQKHNAIWQFFASVRLALVTISLLAITSIIGTIIPQKKPFAFYAGEYGDQLARLFHVLDIPDMYNSWWFVSLLALLCFNLIICSLDRFPAAWKQITADGLARPTDRLATLPTGTSWQVATDLSVTADRLADRLRDGGWKPARKNESDHALLFCQKGAWTRTGVYIVHASILVIFLGGVIGAIGGFKGSMVIPETMQRDRVALFDSQSFRDLGFTVRCNSFLVDFYPNGAPKDYVSSLTIIEDGEEVLTREIRVNDPLTYRGITFYQSSYQSFQDFLITLENTATDLRESFIVEFQKQERWPAEGLRFGVINAKAMGQSVVSSKLWISDDQGAPVTLWLDKTDTDEVQLGERTYLVGARQMYATGLQVAKDPGVWWVYAGCSLMLIGLYIAFFTSHRRLWVLVSAAEKGATVLLAGSANKNRPGFTRTMEELEQLLRTEQHD
jgi:cytochrome c biogenesis protein